MAEALRDPVLHDRTRQVYIGALERIAELADRWRDKGHLPADADTETVAATLLSIMLGLIVMHHVVKTYRRCSAQRRCATGGRHHKMTDP